MDAAKRTHLERRQSPLLQRILLRGQVLKRGLLLLLEARIRLDDPVLELATVKVRRKLLAPREHVLRELPVVRALLDDRESSSGMFIRCQISSNCLAISSPKIRLTLTLV